MAGVYTGTVDQDVRGSNGRLAIPRGSQVELIIRVAPDKDLILDLESAMVNGQRYAVAAEPDRLDARRGDGVGENRSTAEHVGGGAILGSIIGAIAGGGKGSRDWRSGRSGRRRDRTIADERPRESGVPAESILTFRVDQPMVVGVADRGRDRDGYHYHDYGPDR